MKRFLFFVLGLAGLAAVMSAQPLMSYSEAERQADEVLKTLTIEEKCGMTRGHNKFFLPGVPDKGLPHIFTTDASVGIRLDLRMPNQEERLQPDKTTRFPASISLAATFNPELAYDYAEAVGEEARMCGAAVLLGPGFNIYRSSQCGRNFEYYGEDPYLVSRIVENYVRGMQSTGTLSCLKHFVANNTEFYRKRSNSVVGERALMEIYTPAFKAGIDAGAASVMASYNQLNGEWTGESKYVITDLLRGTLGFEGLVMSDWQSVYDFEKVIKSGLNVEMPGYDYFYIKEYPMDLVKKGVVTEEDIDNMIRPLIATCIRYGLYDRVNSGQEYKWELKEKMPEHVEVAYKTDLEGVVLLKNNGILPLKTSGKVLLAGRWINHVPRGGGSSRVAGYDLITYSEAFSEIFGDRLEIVETPTAEQLAEASAVILVTGKLNAEETEQSFALDKEDEALARLAVENNPNTVVVLNCGSGVDMTGWNDKAAAVLMGWYPGQGGCRAMAEIIMGKVNPSGKLPMTIERSFADSPAVNTVPEGVRLDEASGNPNEYFFPVYDVNYDEGVLVGYRWYEAKGIEPLYPFGYGLSYTDFSLDEAKILGRGKVKTVSAEKPVQINVTLTNTGSMAGAEVVQLYVGENAPTVVRPVKELKGFRKVFLAPGDKQVVSFELKLSDLAFWDETVHEWKTNPGDYTIYIGTSSADIAHELTLKAE